MTGTKRGSAQGAVRTEVTVRAVWAIVALGFLARGAFVALVPVEPVSDFKRYFDVAAGFVDTGVLAYEGWPFISQGVTYPLFLGYVFKFFGIGVLQAKLANLALSGITLAVFARYVLERNWRASVVLLVTAVFAFHPGVAMYPAVLGTETLSLLLIVLALHAASRDGRGQAAWLGAVLALFAMSRPQFLPVLPLFAALRVLQDREHLRPALWTVAVFALVLAPWVIRNRIVFDEWIAVSANSGYGLMVNNNSANRNSGWMPLSEIEIPDDAREAFAAQGAAWFFEPGSEDEKMLKWLPAQDRLARQVGMAWILENPGRFLELSVLRFHRAFTSIDTSMLNWPLQDVGVPRWLAAATNALTTMLYGMGLAGLVLGLLDCRRCDRQLLLSGLVVLAGLFAIFVFEGQGRYTLPMLPCCLVLAAFARERWPTLRGGLP